MILHKLSINNFKNIAEASLEMSTNVNCFLGNNGMGKSNLLDAIYFLSFARSFGRLPDAMLVKKGEEYSILRGSYTRGTTPEEINAGIRPGRKKTFKRGGKEYRRLSEHIGLFPAVMVSPADAVLATGAAEERRRFIDMLISQGDATYLDALIRYNQALEQRNRMLRDGHTDPLLFEAVEGMMCAAAAIITERRRIATERLAQIFLRYYSLIADSPEIPALTYEPSAHAPLADELERARLRDAALHFTSVGPHRDDISLVLDGMPVRQTASQGQTKTFTIALRLAQYEFVRQATGMAPLLLLDDIFDKLDANRVERIISIVSDKSFGQIFITDTNRKHLDEIIGRLGGDSKVWAVENGSFNILAGNEKD